MSTEWAKMAYIRVVTLASYGEGHSFGTYDRDTGELTITDASAMGDRTVAWVQSYCDEAHHADNIGSYVLFGVPRKAYALRERAKYANPENYL